MTKILVRSPNWVGDQILAYPFFYFLRQSMPGAMITSVCAKWVESIQYGNLVDDVVALPRRGSELRASLRPLGPWDLAISLPDSFSSAWLLYRSGAKRRRGYRGDARSFLLNEPVNKPDLIHRSKAYLRLLPEAPSPNDDELGQALSLFDPAVSWSSPTLEPPSEPYFVLAPGSVAESRRWPLESFTELCAMINKETGLKGVIVGGQNEAPLAARLISLNPNFVDFTARGPIASLWKLFKQARFTVTNDSGLAHVASLCGSSIHIVWGAGEPKRTLPLGPGKIQLSLNPIECWPCERNICTQAGSLNLSCLKGIPAERVWEEIRQQSYAVPTACSQPSSPYP